MAKIKDTVSKDQDGTYRFTCPSPTGCGGNPNDASSRFVSSGWPTEAAATDRGEQHINEHLGNGPMQSLEDFRIERGLSVNDKGEVVDLSAYLKGK